MTKKFIYSVFILLIFCFNVAEANEIYYPYPIIFVHGIHSSVITWDYTKGELEKYFKDQTGYKYPLQDSEYGYFPLCDYRGQNKGDISNIAITSLKYFIGLSLDSFPPEVPESDRKVILVCHSMGGLVVRSLLKQDLSGYYASKIDRVVFLGTPHLGSPWASSVWLLNKIRQDIINPVVKDYAAFYSQNVGSRFTFSDASSSVQITGLPAQIYNNLANWLGIEKGRLDKALFLPDVIGFSGSKAVEQLRLNQDVSFKKIIKYLLGYNLAEVELKGTIRGGETFLGKATENLANPRNFKVIRGQNPFPFPLLEKIGDWGISGIYTSYNNYFTFPLNLSLDDTITTGDGIVPQLSQEGLKGLGSADYTVNAFHFDVDLPRKWSRQEVEQYDIILQAIEDKPEIEEVYAIPEDWNKPNTELYGPWSSHFSQDYYLIFKVKDYLLADIEIESLTIGTNPSVDLSMFEADGKCKPYNYRRDEKAFLKERDDTSAIFININGDEEYLKDLKPGEFWVKATIPATATYVKLRIKNPAAEFDAERFTAERTFYIKRPGIANIDWGPYWSIAPGFLAFIDVPPYDYSPLCDEEGNIVVFHYYPSSASRYLDLSFSIVNSPYSEVRCNAWLYNIGLETVWKKFCTNKSATLSGSPYSGVVNDIPRWHGDKEGGGYIEGYDVFNTDYEHDPMGSKAYRLVVTVETTNDDPTDDILPLLGLSLSGGHQGTILCADPTFIQASRRVGISW